MTAQLTQRQHLTSLSQHTFVCQPKLIIVPTFTHTYWLYAVLSNRVGPVKTRMHCKTHQPENSNVFPSQKLHFRTFTQQVFSACVVDSLAKASSTLIRFQTKTELFCSGYGHRPHYNAKNGAIRSDLKTILFENAVF